MKKLCLLLFLGAAVLSGYAEPRPADDILAFVRSKLPDDPLTLTARLKVLAPNGFTRTSLPVRMDLHWGATSPKAHYRIGDETLDITWSSEGPDYRFSNERSAPTSDILDTGITWADLSFSVLWWPGAVLVDEAKKINRDCYVVDVPVPDSDLTMRLWIEKKMGMLLESQTLDARKKQLRRMKIKSIKKIDGMWVAKDLEILDRASGNRTTLQVTDMTWKRDPADGSSPSADGPPK